MTKGGKQQTRHEENALLMDGKNRGGDLRLRLNFTDKLGNRKSFAGMDQFFNEVHMRDGKIVDELTDEELHQIVQGKSSSSLPQRAFMNLKIKNAKKSSNVAKRFIDTVHIANKGMMQSGKKTVDLLPILRN